MDEGIKSDCQAHKHNNVDFTHTQCPHTPSQRMLITYACSGCHVCAAAVFGHSYQACILHFCYFRNFRLMLYNCDLCCTNLISLSCLQITQIYTFTLHSVHMPKSNFGCRGYAKSFPSPSVASRCVRMPHRRPSSRNMHEERRRIHDV